MEFISNYRVLAILSDENWRKIQTEKIIHNEKSVRINSLKELNYDEKYNRFDLIIIEENIIGEEFELLFEKIKNDKELFLVPLIIIADYPYSEKISKLDDEKYLYSVLRNPIEIIDLKLIFKQVSNFNNNLLLFPHVNDETMNFYKKYCHDINNFSGRIMMAASFLEDDSYGEEVVEIATSISDVVTELSNFTNIASEIFTPLSSIKKEIEIDELITSSIAKIKEVYPNSKFGINSSCENFKVEGNPRELTILFMELLKNSYEALEDKKENVSISIEKNSDEIIVVIRNKGTLISEENIKKLPLYSKSSKKSTSHKGIGLTVVRAICSRNRIDFKIKVDGDINFVELRM
jgi:signal transduction histidine kinase